MKIAVIVVNYATAALAAKAVQSVLDRTTDTHDVAVHLVDNASPGGDDVALTDIHKDRDWGDRVRLWLERENHGFGRGNNVVLEHLAAESVPPDFVFLLNPDAELANDALEILAAELVANPKAATVGAAVSRPDGTGATSCFRFPGIMSAVLETLSFGPADKIFGAYRVPLDPDRPAGPVDWVSGAAVMFRFSALLETGFFDSDFFLYFEETELQHRLNRAGWTCHFVPAARVRHAEGAATGQFAGAGSERKLRPSYLYRSKWLYFKKARGQILALGLALMVLPAAGLNVLHRRLRGKAPNLPLNFFRDHMRFGLLPLLGFGSGS